MEKQDRGLPGLPGGGCPDRNGSEAHRLDQAGLHHPAAALPGCGGPGQSQGLRDQLAAVLDELRRIEAEQGVSDELLDTIQMIAAIMNGMQEDFAYDR